MTWTQVIWFSGRFWLSLFCINHNIFIPQHKLAEYQPTIDPLKCILAWPFELLIRWCWDGWNLETVLTAVKILFFLTKKLIRIPPVACNSTIFCDSMHYQRWFICSINTWPVSPIYVINCTKQTKKVLLSWNLSFIREIRKQQDKCSGEKNKAKEVGWSVERVCNFRLSG